MKLKKIYLLYRKGWEIKFLANLPPKERGGKKLL